MENKSYQLRYLSIFETDLLSTVNYITNVLKNEDAADRLVDDIEKVGKSSCVWTLSFCKKERVSILSDLCEELCGILCGYRECYGSKATDI